MILNENCLLFEKAIYNSGSPKLFLLIIFLIQQAPLNMITLGHGKNDYCNQMIPLSELPFPLNESKFRIGDLLKLPKLIPLFDLSYYP